MSLKKIKKSVCLYFQVHQPFRLKNYSYFDAENDHEYFIGPKNYENKAIFEKVALKCYLPATELLISLLKRYSDFKVAFSLSGVFLEQCLSFGDIGKQVLKNFQKISQNSQTELLSETYYHSLSFLHSKLEFAQQIQKHSHLIKKLFHRTPHIFRNTELIYHNEIATFIKQMGFKGILAEGWEHILKNQNPHHVHALKEISLNKDDQKIAKKYKIAAKPSSKFGILLKNYRLSDDIAFRFSDQSWLEYPLTAEKFGSWIDHIIGESVNIFLDFETIGEHQWKDSGIFDFFKNLPEILLKRGIPFKTPSETIKDYPLRETFDCPNYLSWADMERNLSAWLDNDLQKSAFQEIINLEKLIHPLKNSRKKILQSLIHDFRKMQTSDHFYYMSTKYWNDGDIHAYFSPYESPYDAYINYMNVLESLKKRIAKICPNPS